MFLCGSGPPPRHMVPPNTGHFQQYNIRVCAPCLDEHWWLSQVVRRGPLLLNTRGPGQPCTAVHVDMCAVHSLHVCMLHGRMELPRWHMHAC